MLKADLAPALTEAIRKDIAADAYDHLTRAAMRLDAKKMILRSLQNVIPAYKIAGGDINSFQYDVVFLLDPNMIGRIGDRAYWGRMCTDAWRASDNEFRQSNQS